jgi:hypothetical protein
MHILSPHLRRHSHAAAPLRRSLASVEVQVAPKATLVLVPGSLGIVRATAGWHFAPLPKTWAVASPEGHALLPSGIFLLSVESFDPTHILIDAPLAVVEEHHGWGRPGYDCWRASK